MAGQDERFRLGDSTCRSVKVPDKLGRKLAEQTDRWMPEDEPDRPEPADDKED